MVAHLPAAKLGALALKQISKPIANVVKQQAKSSPFFKKWVCIPPAQFYNWCEVQSKMWLLNMGQPVNITVLNEAASIELGATILGEGVIFLIAAGILVSEYNRSSKKEAAKEAEKLAEMTGIRDAIRDLFVQTEEQAAKIRELTRKMGELETHPRTHSNYPSTEREPSPPKEPPSGGAPDVKAAPDYTIKFQDITYMKIEKPTEIDHKHTPRESILLRALSAVETDFLSSYEENREPGIIITALNQLYQDVYRIPLRF